EGTERRTRIVRASCTSAIKHLQTSVLVQGGPDAREENCKIGSYVEAIDKAFEQALELSGARVGDETRGGGSHRIKQRSHLRLEQISPPISETGRNEPSDFDVSRVLVPVGQLNRVECQSLIHRRRCEKCLQQCFQCFSPS